MRLLLFTALVWALAAPLAAQEEFEFDPSVLVEEANEWIRENIDDSALDALGVDKTRVQQFLSEVHKQFQGSAYVYDLAALRDTARQLLPVLHKFEETEPYAVWLKAHLTDLEAAELLRQAVDPKGTNTARLPEPQPETQQRVWMKVIRDAPPVAGTNQQLHTLKRIFREEGVPPELVWIAEIESSFDPRAKSPAGAVGLFQLMPVTARSLDLSVGMLRDERTDPEKSARAAARYLRRLHQRFGDWRLAAAAYNCGETRVANLLKKYRARSFEEISRFLPTETQMYVPKLETTLKKREGQTLRDLRLRNA
jgi:membrane-bound lytic murein transglycosylase D